MTSLGQVPHVVVDDVSAPVLAEEDRRHLTRSLRSKDGDKITVTDGAGNWRVCRLGATVSPIGEVHQVPAPQPPLTVAFARTKGERPELAVQKLTELGVDQIIVFEAERSVARWADDRVERNRQRLERIVREAVMQSRRVRCPELRLLSGLDEVVAACGSETVAMTDIAGEPPCLDRPVLLVGPEGGWSPAERDLGLPLVRMSDQVLRAETAAITAGAILTTMRSGLLQSSAHGDSNA